MSRQLLIAFCLLAVCCVRIASAQYPSPSAEHERLKALEGRWNLAIKTPDAGESKGASVCKLECNGLWLATDFQCEFGGSPFHGKGLDGYDPIKKKYVSVWVDSVMPSPMNFEVDFDESGRTMNITCKSVGPDGKPAAWRSVYRIITEDQHSFEMFLTPQGGVERSLMVVEYARAK